MANEIMDKFGSSTAFDIDIASMTDAAGEQSAIVVNTANRYQDALVYVKIKTQAGAGANTTLSVHLIRDDNHATNHRSDGAIATKQALVVVNAPLIGVIALRAAGAQTEYGEFLVHRVGPLWGIAIVNNTGATLDVTGSNHWARYVGLNPEVQ